MNINSIYHDLGNYEKCEEILDQVEKINLSNNITEESNSYSALLDWKAYFF